MEPTLNKITNLQFLIDTCQGNKPVVIKMIEIFLKNTPDMLENINISYEIKDWVKVKQIAHKMQASLGTLGAIELKNKISRVEQIIQNQEDLSEIGDLLEHVSNKADLLYKELQEEIEMLQQ